MGITIRQDRPARLHEAKAVRWHQSSTIQVNGKAPVPMSISITYPPFLNEVADVFGNLRMQANNQVREMFSEFSRGTQNESLDRNGILCEMIVAYWLESTNKKYEMGELLGGAMAVPDIIVGDTRLDVKWMSGDEFRVNSKAHRKKNDVTHYAFVKITHLNYARIYIVKYEDVNNWEEKTAYTPFLFKKI
jgi:hypothetical protein